MIESIRPYPERTKGMTDERICEIREQINALYCKYLCEEPTELLEDLVLGHVAGQIKRAERTLDIVQKELLERVVNENKESDNF